MLTEGFTLTVYPNRVNNVEVGKRLRNHREGQPKVSLEALCNATGKSLSPSRISNYEQGIRSLKPRDASILAAAFTKLGKPVTATFLLGLEGKSDPALKYKDAPEVRQYIAESLIDSARLERCYNEAVTRLLEQKHRAKKEAWDPMNILRTAVALYNLEIKAGVPSHGEARRKLRKSA
jgi:transcriptional regulator with XRE-family HTH domain